MMDSILISGRHEMQCSRSSAEDPSDKGIYLACVHWLLFRGLIHLMQQAGDWCSLYRTVPNVAAHPSKGQSTCFVIYYMAQMSGTIKQVFIGEMLMNYRHCSFDGGNC